MSVWALLVAAGTGERLGGDRPKAFVGLGELPLLAEPLRRLDESSWVDAIVVAAPPGWEEPTILLAEELAATKVVAAVTGGETRAESVRTALAEVPQDALVALVHDAARPLVTDAVIERVLAPLSEGWDGADSGAPAAGHGQARRGRTSRRDDLPRRARRRPDAAGLSRRRRCATPTRATSPARPTARRSSRRAAAA